jgi:hypothetical protein
LLLRKFKYGSGRTFIDQLHSYQLLREDPASWSDLILQFQRTLRLDPSEDFAMTVQ